MMGAIGQINEMDSLTPQNFNEFVKSRSRSPSPLRDLSPTRPNIWARAQEDMEEDVYNIPTPEEHIGCQELLEYKCSHCGWLRKRRNRKTLNQIFGTWPQAYVVLYDGCLYYYKNEKARTPAGKFSLYGYNSVFRASEILPKEAPWSFKIVHSHKEFKTYFFSASSEQEMKIWMSCIKKELLHANGKTAKNGKVNKDKDDKAEVLDDQKFYQDIEQNIYEDSSKFIPTKDYMKKCSVKRENEDSDDEDLIINPEIDNRPPCPLPQDQQKLCHPLRPPLKPARIVQEEIKSPTPPQTPPRTRRKQDRDASPSTNKMQALQITEEIEAALKKRKSPKRKGSYEKTDGPGQKSPAGNAQIKFDYRHAAQQSGGGSNGEDDPEHVDTEEYWGSIHFDDKDKTKAHDIIQGIGENGVFMVRPENTGAGKVLVVYACDQTKKYRIQQTSDGQYYLAKEGYHNASLEELLYYYYENDLPTISQKLIRPYRLHPKYKNLKI